MLGRQALAARQCTDDTDDFYGSPCSDLTSSITAAPTARPSFHPKNNIISITCNPNGLCSAYDVSSSLVTTFNGSDITRTDSPIIPITSSPCQGAGCPSSIPLMTTGTGLGSAPSDTSRGPFANGTDSTFAPGPTGTAPSGTSRGPFANGTDTAITQGPTGTGTGRVSATGISSAEANSTTYIRSTITRSVTTFTDSSHWSAWTNWPGASGTGASSGFPASPTSNGPFSNTTSTPTLINSTFVSAGQTVTTEAPSAPYTSTATFIFSGTTVEIPIPDSFTNSLPSVSSPARTTPAQSTAPFETPAPQASTLTTSCRMTTNFASSGTATAIGASSTLICWGLACDDQHGCYDFVDHYTQTADATVTATSSGPFSNSTASPTTTDNIYPGDSTISALPTDSPTSVWPSSNSTRNPDAYTTSNTATINATGTITPTIAQPVITNNNAVYTFTATDSAGNPFTTTYTGDLPASWIDAPSDSSVLVSDLSTGAATSSTATSNTSAGPSTYAWADWPSTLATSTSTSTSSLSSAAAADGSIETSTTRTFVPRPATDTSAPTASLYGGESRSDWKRAGAEVKAKAIRAGVKEAREVKMKDFGLERRAVEMEKMGMDADVDGNVDEVACHRVWCRLW
ncbi:hypothetical protein OHC33_008070 [Knufia fluminis]|uniref:Uncharacterized protein n=1 Tax=Knufia fluminis TaxID=191047 RepID=A0AAN8ES60_9EURO|nr:hypothetical protein OHC33_008070 [Knufia fluminis]